MAFAVAYQTKPLESAMLSVSSNYKKLSYNPTLGTRGCDELGERQTLTEGNITLMPQSTNRTTSPTSGEGQRINTF